MSGGLHFARRRKVESSASSRRTRGKDEARDALVPGRVGLHIDAERAFVRLGAGQLRGAQQQPHGLLPGRRRGLPTLALGARIDLRGPLLDRGRRGAGHPRGSDHRHARERLAAYRDDALHRRHRRRSAGGVSGHRPAPRLGVLGGARQLRRRLRAEPRALIVRAGARPRSPKTTKPSTSTSASAAGSRSTRRAASRSPVGRASQVASSWSASTPHSPNSSSSISAAR